MPKIKTISRTEKDFERETKSDMMKISRSTNPLNHPFQKVSLFWLTSNSRLVSTKEQL